MSNIYTCNIDEKPLVSVIIPTYNVIEYIDECISSILGQTYDNIEIILCDDCSSDGTYDYLVTKYNIPNVKILKNDTNLKAALTRNRCIENASGEYILLQDADDVSDHTRVECLIKEFEDGIDFVGSGCYCFNDDDGVFDKIHGRRKYPQKKDLLKGMPYVHASIMFRKNVLDAIGGYREGKWTSRNEDFDLIMRLHAAGYKGKNIENLLYGYRINRETIQRRTFKARVDECVIRMDGFRRNNILFPLGFIYVFKPILAYVYQFVKYKKIIRTRNNDVSP